MPQVDRAVLHKLAWKSETTRRYASALVRAGMACHRRGVMHFNNDDVAEHEQPLDRTTVGACVRLLSAENVIAHWRGTIDAEEIHGGMRRSTRPGNHEHRNQLYQLTSYGLANRWLVANGTEPEPVQGELF